MDIKILLQAFSSPWMIHPESAQQYALIAARIIAGNDNGTETKEGKEAFAYTVNAAGKIINSSQDAVDSGVAVINLKGAVMKYDYCGAAGTQTLIQALQAANDNPAIAAIVLQIESPGGAVDGTEQMANAVKNSAKPVVAFINGMMCSAAMWIGSAASMRIASSKTDIIGSIGTMSSWNDYSGYMKQLGIVQHEVYATDSTDKNLAFREANGKNAKGESNYEPLVKTWLDPLNSIFHETVKENLPGADQSVFSGASYLATEAKKKGLIDKIGTFQDAVNQALKMAQTQNPTQAQSQTENKNPTSMKWTKFLAILGITGAVSSAKDIKLEDNQADSIEAALAENETLKANLQTANTDLKTAQDGLTAMTAERDSVQAKLDTANEKIKGLEAQDAIIPAAATAEKDKEQEIVADAASMDFQKELFAKL